MRRYQVVIYSWDIGTDDKMDFNSLVDAIKDAKKYKGREEYAAVYDTVEKIAYVVFGNKYTSVFTDNVRIVAI